MLFGFGLLLFYVICVFIDVESSTSIYRDTNPVSLFKVQDHVVTAALDKPIKCSLHGDIKIQHMAPDLVSNKWPQNLIV